LTRASESTRATTPAFLTRGDGGTAVFLLHGIGGGKAFWERQLDALAESGYRAVAWDMPGYGESAAAEPYTLPELARALERLIDDIAASRVVLLGHSMGGMVALEAWAAFPRKIAALILACTSPAFGKPDGAWQQEFLRQRLGPLDQGRSMADLAPRLVPGMVAAAADTAAVERAIDIMSAVPPATYRSALQALMSFDRRALLSSISVPALALAGDVDSIAPPAVMRKMAEKIPGAAYECLTETGHLASLEHPERFNQSVLGFLKTRL
jgi:3-oxoadipate enol-lactonase